MRHHPADAHHLTHVVSAQTAYLVGPGVVRQPYGGAVVARQRTVDAQRLPRGLREAGHQPTGIRGEYVNRVQIVGQRGDGDLVLVIIGAAGQEIVRPALLLLEQAAQHVCQPAVGIRSGVVAGGGQRGTASEIWLSTGRKPAAAGAVRLPGISKPAAMPPSVPRPLQSFMRAGRAGGIKETLWVQKVAEQILTLESHRQYLPRTRPGRPVCQIHSTQARA